MLATVTGTTDEFINLLCERSAIVAQSVPNGNREFQKLIKHNLDKLDQYIREGIAEMTSFAIMKQSMNTKADIARIKGLFLWSASLGDDSSDSDLAICSKMISIYKKCYDTLILSKKNESISIQKSAKKERENYDFVLLNYPTFPDEGYGNTYTTIKMSKCSSHWGFDSMAAWWKLLVNGALKYEEITVAKRAFVSTISGFYNNSYCKETYESYAEKSIAISTMTKFIEKNSNESRDISDDKKDFDVLCKEKERVRRTTTKFVMDLYSFSGVCRQYNFGCYDYDTDEMYEEERQVDATAQNADNALGEILTTLGPERGPLPRESVLSMRARQADATICITSELALILNNNRTRTFFPDIINQPLTQSEAEIIGDAIFYQLGCRSPYQYLVEKLGFEIGTDKLDRETMTRMQIDFCEYLSQQVLCFKIILNLFSELVTTTRRELLNKYEIDTEEKVPKNKEKKKDSLPIDYSEALRHAERRIKVLGEENQRLFNEKNSATKRATNLAIRLEEAEKLNQKLSKKIPQEPKKVEKVEKCITEQIPTVAVEKKEVNYTFGDLRALSDRYKIVIAGGDENLLKKIRAEFPKIVVFESKAVSGVESFIRNADFIFFRYSSLNHSLYQAIKNVTKSKNIKYDYLTTSTSLELLVNDICLKINKAQITAVKEN